jgi:SNF2 family DNA or RNA helicase
VDDVIFAFNLPGPPYILLCTAVAREGIDLHRWCRRVMHYDLEWNPAYSEQEVGRVDRMQSLSWRETKPVEIYYVWQPGTYEERIAKAVEHRLVMMRTLLGAGAWLAADPEEQELFDQLEDYRLEFSP